MPNQYITISNFLGGINEQVDDSLLSLNEASKVQNFSISDGSLTTASGSVITNTLSSAVATLMKFFDNSTGHFLASAGSSIYNIDTATPASIKSGLSSVDFDYVNYDINGAASMILCNGVDNTMVYNGNTVRSLLNRRKVYNEAGVVTSYIDANGTSHASEATVATYAPKGKFVELHYERLWTAGVSTTPNSVYFSTANVHGFDPDDWTYPLAEGEANQHGGVIDIPTWDGGVIIGLKVLFNDILIFKNKNIFRIFGTYPGNYSKEQLFSTDGAIADKSIVATSKAAMFIASEGIYMFDGVNTTKVSAKIQKTWDTLNKDYLSKAVAVFYKDKYIVAVPEGSSTTNNLVIEYDMNRGSFVFRRGITVNSMIEYKDKLYYADGVNVHRYNTGTTYNGSLISALYETGDIDCGAKSALKSTEMLYFVGSGNGSVKITCTADKRSRELIVPLTSSETLYRKRFVAKGRVMKFKFENVDGSQITIKSPQFLVEFDYD